MTTETELRVTGQTISHEGRIITLTYTRAPEPDEEMDAREWAKIKADYMEAAREYLAKHPRGTVEVYGDSPEAEWMIEAIDGYKIGSGY